MLLRSKMFTLIAVLALGLGIGANTTIFSVVNVLLFRPLPYANADQIVSIGETNAFGVLERVAPANILDWREQNRVFDQLATFEFDGFNMSGEGEPESISGVWVSPTLFKLLGVEAALGRVFYPGEEDSGTERALVLSHGLWQRRFNGDTTILGRKITLYGIDNPQGGDSYTIIGVLPANFWFVSEQFGVWALRKFTDEQLSNREARSQHVIGRLKAGVSIDGAQAEMNRINSQLIAAYPQTNAGRGVLVTSLKDAWVGEIGAASLILLTAVCFVLLIGCANAANLLLARAAARQKEISIRAALGAKRGRIIRQLLTESVILAGLAGGFGILLAYWCTKIVIRLIPAEARSFIPGGAEAMGMDLRVLLFTLSVSVLTGIIFGLAPAFIASKPNVNETLKESVSSAIHGGRRQRLRSLLVISEVALSLVLLIGAGVMVKGFLQLQGMSLGFNWENTLKMSIFVPQAKYQEGAQQSAFYKQVLERVAALPGVKSVSVADNYPLRMPNRSLFTIQGRPMPNRNEIPVAANVVMSSDYFKTIGVSLVRGNQVSQFDTAETPPVVIINETMARRYWPKEDPIGKRIRPGGLVSLSPWLTIIGIVKDVKEELSVEPVFPTMYRNYLQSPQPYMYLLARTASDPNAMAVPIRNEIRAVDKDQPISDIASMEKVLSDAAWGPRFLSLLLSTFGLLALAMASLGIYGVISYFVSMRTQEIGIRLALGAQKRDIVKLVLGRGLALTGIGIAIGLIAGIALARLLSSMVVEVSANEPITLAGVTALLCFVALIANYIPARRATKVDPIIALRTE